MEGVMRMPSEIRAAPQVGRKERKKERKKEREAGKGVSTCTGAAALADYELALARKAAGRGRQADRQAAAAAVHHNGTDLAVLQCMVGLTCGVDPHGIPHRLLLLLALEGPHEDKLACRQHGDEK
jgi:hypothetical protein